jgi:hypothetical protein
VNWTCLLVIGIIHCDWVMSYVQEGIAKVGSEVVFGLKPYIVPDILVGSHYFPGTHLTTKGLEPIHSMACSSSNFMEGRMVA